MLPSDAAAAAAAAGGDAVHLAIRRVKTGPLADISQS